MRLIAIDPGLGGGIAWLDSHGVVNVRPMPEEYFDLKTLIFSLASSVDATVAAYVEEPIRFAGKDVPSSTMVPFAYNAGFCVGLLTGLGASVCLIRPQTWQKALGCGTSRAIGKKLWKGHLRSMATELYPGLHPTKKTADALLILRYAMNEENYYEWNT